MNGGGVICKFCEYFHMLAQLPHTAATEKEHSVGRALKSLIT